IATGIGCGRMRFGRQILFVLKTPYRFTVNEQNAIEHAVFAHQILRRRDLLVFLYFLFRKSLDSSTHPARGNENPACLDESAAAGLIDVFHRYDAPGSGTEHE